MDDKPNPYEAPLKHEARRLRFRTRSGLSIWMPLPGVTLGITAVVLGLTAVVLWSNYRAIQNLAN